MQAAASVTCILHDLVTCILQLPRLQPYNFIVEYRTGSLNLSDYLSRHPVQDTCTRNHNIGEAFVQFIAKSAVPKAMSIEEIKSATAQDHTFQELKEMIVHNSWQLLNNAQRLLPNVDLQELQALSRVKQDLCLKQWRLDFERKSHSYTQSATCKSSRPCTSASFRNCQNQVSIAK